jgi:hypothetical protein
MSERLPFLPPPQIDNVAELGVHRERAVVFGDLFDAARALAAPDRVLREERRKDKEAQQAALPIATTKVLYDQRGFGRFLAADVKAQLKLRSVPFKHNDKLGVLDELWKAHDAGVTNFNAIPAGGVAGGGNSGGGNGAGAAALAVAPAAAHVASSGPRTLSEQIGGSASNLLPPATTPVAIAATAAAVPTAVAAVAARAKNVCGLCRQEGHNRKTCRDRDKAAAQ